MARPDEAPTIRVIANAAEIIEVLADGGPRTPAELAERVGMPRSSTYRLIDGLAAISLVDIVDDGRVRLSSRWIALADAAHASLTEWATASTELRRLVDRTGHTAFLSVPGDGQAVCIDWCRGSQVAVLALKPGGTLPLHAGAGGRVLLATAVDVDSYLANAPFAPLTRSTLTDERSLRDDVALTRERGYVLSSEDVTEGVSAVGMPIINRRTSVHAAISLAGPTRTIEEDVESLVEAMREAVRTIDAAA